MSAETKAAVVDLDVENHGSLVLLRPRTPRAEQWVRESCEAPDWAWMGGALAVEPRMVEAIVQGASSSGLAVRGVSL